ncbi:hypothetical protein AQI95_05120 [Streptomyces yokosukanensis]|uniref:NAD(P)-binding domain-containing protein n=1 Tax=Streptomyces yokosukanensis TaxID=67386 RepID=A0A101PCZ0_9ACTN|nr:hypothetical protein [Streptomyces yokosukanensis]KUN09228.1 hypothetical protein AQI95_05120 [Streptomyces yokosukanensis]
MCVSARRPEPGRFPDGGGVFAADPTVPAGLGPGFEGVGQVFLYANHDGVDGVIETARAAGVDRIVLLSCTGPLHRPRRSMSGTSPPSPVRH